MTGPIEELERALQDDVALEFTLETLGSDRFAVLGPFTFDDGDRLPVVVSRHNGGWRMSDEGGLAMHLSYEDVAFDEGNRARLIEQVGARYGLTIKDWELVRELPQPPSVGEVLDFFESLIRIADVEFLARETVASTFLDDVRAFLRELVPSDALHLDYYLEERDVAGTYRIDVAIRRDGRPDLFGFAVANETQAREAAITLLMLERWEVAHDSFVVFERQEELARRPLAQLSDVVGKQFSQFVGNEDRIRRYLTEAGVRLDASTENG